MKPSYDIAVVGLGIVGSSALWRAAVRGASVIGIERFEPPHSRGSSHGGSRIFRRTLFEGDHYIPLAQRADDLWQELDEAAGQRLRRTTGGLVIAPEDSARIARAITSAERGGVDVEVLDATALASRYPQHAQLAGDIAVFEPGAGVLHPENSIRAALTTARRLGAEMVTGTRVTAIEEHRDHVEIVVADGEPFTARRLILAAGAWITELVPQLKLPLTIQRSPLVWFRGSDMAAFGPDRFPTFVRVNDRVDCWGIPDVDGQGVKVGFGQGFAHKPTLASADENWRHTDERDTGPAQDAVRVAFPGLIPRVVHAEPCVNSRTPDRDFLLGIHPEAPAIVLASGFSGHGFKHATASGDVAVDLALTGTSEIPIERFSPTRFAQDR